MKLNVLLVNPWIYDFAAYNLWARPLGLLKVAEYLSCFDTELSFIDCTDSFTTNKNGSGRYREETVKKPALLKAIPRLYRRYGITTDDFADKLRSSPLPDVVLITSMMSYWYPGVQETIAMIRDRIGQAPIILGGIYATLYQEHASRCSGADFIYKGSLSEALHIALYTFGFRLRKKKVRVPYYRLNLYENYPFAPLLTSEGCAFRCSYCASSLLVAARSRRSPEDILREIEDLHAIGVRDYAFYDDALLADADTHIKPLFRGIIKAAYNIRFHSPNGLHARFIDQELAALMKAVNFRTIRLSLETVDEKMQEITGAKVNNEDVERAVRYLREQGFSGREVGVYLMCGLPKQGLAEVREGVRFLKTLRVRINLTEFSPIRGTKCWDDMVRDKIIDDDIDPLLTNNTVFTYLYSGCGWDEVENLKLDVKDHNETLP
ncbi:MAG: B12-binding domain-containing radical SAM protein [Dissulfurispiraceae bacterium]